MTRMEAQQVASKYWGTALAVAAAAIYYGISVWYDGSAPDEAKITAVMAGVVGIAKWLAQKNKTDTKSAVEATMDFEKLMAALGIRQRFQELEAKQDSHHRQNSEKLETIISGKHENDRLHAEHVSVTDSLVAGVTALNTAVRVLQPEFVAPPIHQRRAAVSEKGESSPDDGRPQ
jgi:hypothetical protein